MEAEDLKPSRIESAKNVIEWFIDNLQTDRLWLVVFAWKPFTSIPLTFDYNILSETISRLQTNNIDQSQRWLNWTAIWDSILMAKTLFKAPKNISEEEYSKREKVIILLTDWDANVWVDPILAWLSAKQEWIKVYTIWIWSKQWWTITYNVWPFKKQQKIASLNDKTLKQIAQDTNALYFRAENNNAFNSIFEELSKLEKNDIDIEIKKEYSEYYDVFLYSLIVLLTIFSYLMLSNIEIRKNNN
jgi:Ca-activated chloride channel family protein